MNPFTDGLQQIVGNLNPGEKFRFKEDPLKTIYTFSPIIDAKGYLNHSTINGHRDYAEAALGQDTLTFDQQRKQKKGEYMGRNMEPTIPHNFRKTWETQSITPALGWNPFVDGEISNGIRFRFSSL